MAIKDPVIIIGCPRSGTTMLFNILNQSKELFTLYRESWNVIKGAYHKGLLNPIAIDDSLTVGDMTPELKEYLLDQFNKYSVNNEALSYWIINHLKIRGLTHHLPIPNPLVTPLKLWNAFVKDVFVGDYRLLEKTPRNCFRVAFMNQLFPDAKFVFIQREANANISSLMEGWRKNASWINHQRFPELDDSDFAMSNFEYKKWEYVLPPGWREFNAKSLEETCAHQWIQSNSYALRELDQLDQSRVIKIKYEDLVADPATTVKSITDFIEVPYEGKLKQYAEKPPVVSSSMFEKPREDKWKKNQEALERIQPVIARSASDVAIQTR
ncbi:MAG: sulfotransferase [Candidatus Melainabacteria bacterium]|jgi:hypothetical protein|nr:sulfotransferase [Candidatus Melainabacteria bacterium]